MKLTLGPVTFQVFASTRWRPSVFFAIDGPVWPWIPEADNPYRDDDDDEAGLAAPRSDRTIRTGKSGDNVRTVDFGRRSR